MILNTLLYVQAIYLKEVNVLRESETLQGKPTVISNL